MKSPRFGMPLVAGARGGEKQARQYEDDQVPILVKRFREFFEELQPEEGAPVRYYYHEDVQEQKALVVTFQWAGIERKLSIVEYYDIQLRDLALEVRLDDELVAILPEPKETPWFFDKEYLSQNIAERRVGTFIDILNWLVWPILSLFEDLALLPAEKRTEEVSE